MKKIHELFMHQALREAKKASGHEDVPVGALIVYEDKIISRACNQVELLHDPTAHAEMIALTAATNFFKAKWLKKCSMYVTIEPCSMCAGALVLARIKEVFFGAADPKAGACGSALNIANNSKLNHRIKVKSGILSQDCAALLQEFFRKQRLKQAALNN
ncbi:MAG: tRNA adenosine(34) deaminase TadA [Candidatus Omnitrophota bacterium]